MIIRLPVPPSVNELYGSRRDGGRYIRPKYRAWITEADGWYLEQRGSLKRISGPYTVQIRLPRIRGDGDNKIKATLDQLVRLKLTDDDRHCRKSSAEIDPSLTGYCEVTVEAANTPHKGRPE